VLQTNKDLETKLTFSLWLYIIHVNLLGENIIGVHDYSVLNIFKELNLQIKEIVATIQVRPLVFPSNYISNKVGNMHIT
jgi:hypothetical protein